MAVRAASRLYVVTAILVLAPHKSVASILRGHQEGKHVSRHDLRKPSSSSRGIVMSCPMAEASNSAGDWKPSNLFNGFSTGAKLLRELGCRLPIYNILYYDELETARQHCESISQVTPGASCLGMPREGQEDYGYSKVFAVRAAPVNQVMFIDCDAFFVRDPTYLFDDPNFTEIGALFWPDIEGHYGSEPPRVDAAVQVVPEERKQYADSWWFRQGYDTGLLLVNKAVSGKPFGVLMSMLDTQGDSEHKLLEILSMGDKDLWHLAWLVAGPICDESTCSLMPFVGATGICMPDDRQFHMSSQAKLDREGKVVALHQIRHLSIGGVDQLISPSQLISIDIVGRQAPQTGDGSENPNDVFYGFHAGGIISCDTMAEEFSTDAVADVPDSAQQLVLEVNRCWHQDDQPCSITVAK